MEIETVNMKARDVVTLATLIAEMKDRVRMLEFEVKWARASCKDAQERASGFDKKCAAAMDELETERATLYRTTLERDAAREELAAMRSGVPDVTPPAANE